jgi:hypothetical protein
VGSSFSVSEGSCDPWAIAVRGWVGSSSMSVGSVSGGGWVIVRERAVVAVRGRSLFVGGRGSRVGSSVWCRWCGWWWIMVVWDCRS